MTDFSERFFEKRNEEALHILTHHHEYRVKNGILFKFQEITQSKIVHERHFGRTGENMCLLPAEVNDGISLPVSCDSLRRITVMQQGIVHVHGDCLIVHAVDGQSASLGGLKNHEIEEAHFAAEVEKFWLRCRKAHLFLEILQAENAFPGKEGARTKIAVTEAAPVKVGIQPLDAFRIEEPEIDVLIGITLAAVRDHIRGGIIKSKHIADDERIGIQIEEAFKRGLVEGDHLRGAPAEAMFAQPCIGDGVPVQYADLRVFAHAAEQGGIAVHDEADRHVRAKKMPDAPEGGLGIVAVRLAGCDDDSEVLHLAPFMA